MAKDWDVSIAATLGKESSLDLANGATVDYGGSAGDMLVKYRISCPVEASVQAGIGYSHTPAQLSRVEGLLGASVGGSPAKGVRVYANPKLLSLQDNSLVAIGLEA